MAAAPFTAAELAGLRAAAEHTDPDGMTRRLLATLATVEADRNALCKELATARTAQRQAEQDAKASHENFHTLSDLLDKANKERDAARAEVIALREVLGLGLGDAMQRTADLAREVIDLRRERDHQRARAEAIEGAARALVADLDNPEASLTWSCRECPRVSTCQAAGACYCDEHSPGGGWDTTYAPSIRTLRALLKEGA